MVHIVRVGYLMDRDYAFLTTTSGAAPPTDCDIGTWDFSQDCQSAHIITAGM